MKNAIYEQLFWVTKMLMSICIPTYNRAEQVEKCVKECLEIEGDFFEVVVVDDCSSDDTFKRIGMIKDDRLRYIRNNVNMGFSNMARGLKEGKGEYCLFLGDKDRICADDWNNIIKKLQNNRSASIFHWKYYGKDNIVIRNVTCSNQNRLCKRTFDSLLHAKYHFAYSAAFMFRREDIDRVWGDIDKTSLIWRLYPQAVLAIFLSLCGDTVYLEDLKTVRKDEDIRIHYKQTYEGLDVPYWHLDSRRVQNQEWIDLIFKLDVDEELRCHLIHTVCVEAIKQYGVYYELIKEDSIYKNSLVAEAEDIVKEDRGDSYKEIIKKCRKDEKNLLDYSNRVGKWKQKYLRLEIEYYMRRLKMKKLVFRQIRVLV